MKKILSLFAILVFLSGFSLQDDWIELLFVGKAICSSELEPGNPFEGELGPYGAHNLLDDDPATAWVEGVKGYGKGEYFHIDLGYALPEKLEIRNGYQKSETVFKKNSRVKSIKVTLFVGFHMPGHVTEIGDGYYAKQIGSENLVVLRDAMVAQSIPLPVDPETAFKERVNLTRDFRMRFRERLDDVKEYETPMELHYFLKFEIADVYPGSSWDDTCISDILCSDMITDPVSSDEIIRKIYEPEGNDMVLFNTDIRSGIVLVNMRELKEYKETSGGAKMAIALMDASSDNEWAQVDYMFSAPGSRVEEYPVLYHIRTGRRVDEDILGKGIAMYGFSDKDGIIWLETDIGPIDLNAVKLKIKEQQLLSPANK
ncbi:MAG TPA: hypothetical protein VMV47_16435 [Bacteroidales bacterium]|nr:hypothetical protein [Bacteroidales bacterium]